MQSFCFELAPNLEIIYFNTHRVQLRPSDDSKTNQIIATERFKYFNTFQSVKAFHSNSEKYQP